MPDVFRNRAGDNPGAGAPAIELTPAMIRAGVSALCRYDSEFETREEGAEAIFRAMLLASKINWRIVRGQSVAREK
jgi:hypothetical protein